MTAKEVIKELREVYTDPANYEMGCINANDPELAESIKYFEVKKLLNHLDKLEQEQKDVEVIEGDNILDILLRGKGEEASLDDHYPTSNIEKIIIIVKKEVKND